MLFNVAHFSSLLLVPAVLAVPSALEASIARLRERRLSQPGNRFVGAASHTTSVNYAGAVVTEDAGALSWITGTLTVPTVSGSTEASVITWVSLDATTNCESAVFLAAGVISNFTSNGQPEYSAAFDWYPAIVQHPSGITISAGDVIRLTVIAFSATSGKVEIENLTNGNTVSESLTSSVPLCLQSAEWLLEDFTPDVPPADFGTVTFIDAVAGGMAGTYTPSECNVTLVDIKQNNTVLTSTTASGSSVTTKYV